jgi:hypothetical protein
VGTRTQVAQSGVDVDGISIITATRSITDAHRGMIYSPATLAAVTPVHLHPLTPGRYLMTFSRRWHTATSAAGDPGAYSDYTEDTSPGWAIVEGSGVCRIPGVTPVIPGPAGRTLTAACSRANEYIYLLSTFGSDALIQHLRYSVERDQMTEMAQETIPSVTIDGQTVVFDRGIYMDGPRLTVIGAGLTDHKIYLAHKHWGRVGSNRVSARGGLAVGNDLDDPRWRYRTATGWSIDPAELSPLPLTTVGPVSTAQWQDRLYLSTVEADGDDRFARVWASRRGAAWSAASDPIPLGSVSDDTYLGGTLQFQQHLSANPDRTPIGGGAGIPFVIAVRLVDDTDESTVVSWGLWLVTPPQVSKVAFTINLTPQIGMVGAPIDNAYDVGLPVTLTPQINMVGNGTSVAAFTVTLTPQINMVGSLANVSTVGFTVTLTPAVGMAGDTFGNNYDADFAVTLTPAIGMVVAGISVAAFTVTLTPAIGMVAGSVNVAAFTITLTPQITMEGVLAAFPYTFPFALD